MSLRTSNSLRLVAALGCFGAAAAVFLDFEVPPAVDFGDAPEITGNLQLPIVSLEASARALFGRFRGIMANPDVRRSIPCHVSLPGYSGPAKLKLHGGSSRQHSVTLKKSFRVYLPHATKLLRSGSYDNWSVRSCTNPTYVHDELARRVFASTGHFAILGEFVNVKLNGEYWGLYVLMDRPDARMAAQLHAEVFLKDGDPVVGDVHAWEDLISVCRDGDWADVVSRLDVRNYADYLATNIRLRMNDWPRRNWIAYKNPLWRFTIWDADRCLGDAGDLPVLANQGVCRPYYYLKERPEFHAILKERINVLADMDIEAIRKSLVRQMQHDLPNETKRWKGVYYRHSTRTTRQGQK